MADERTIAERLAVVEDRIAELREDVSELQALHTVVTGQFSALQTLNQRFDGYVVRFDAFAVRFDEREAREVAERKRGQQRRAEQQARTNKGISLLLTAFGAFLATALGTGFLYINATFKSIALDVVVVVVAMAVALLLLLVYRQGPVETI